MKEYLEWLRMFLVIISGFLIGITVATGVIKYTQWLWKAVL